MEVLYDRVDIQKVEPMNDTQYYVRGCTALLDALGGAIHHIKNVHRYAREEDVPEKTLFIITTDGMENASCKYSYDRVRKMVEQEKETLDEIKSCNAVCVHIRVGDYKDAKNKRFDVVTPEYFQRGIQYIQENVADPVFYVFTNDSEAVMKQYNIPDAHYVTGFTDYQDMRLMMACKHFIISNSTFSWWTSYLAEFPGKLIIVPKKWRNNQEQEPALMTSKTVEYVRL